MQKGLYVVYYRVLQAYFDTNYSKKSRVETGNRIMGLLVVALHPELNVSDKPTIAHVAILFFIEFHRLDSP